MIRIRTMMTTVVMAATLFATAAAPGSAQAALECSPSVWGNGQSCVAGIRSHVAGQFAAAVGAQRMSQWCWAASISMVMRHHGYQVSQQRIVREVYGNLVDRPSSGWQILGQLNRIWVDDYGRRFRVQADATSASPATAAQDLAADQPLIIGTHGHAMVLTAVEYDLDVWGNGQVTGAVVRDPWPGRGRRSISGAEWYDTALLVRIRVTPL